MRGPARRVLLLLDGACGNDDLSASALVGSDKSLYTLVCRALEGFVEVGGYLARVKVTQDCEAATLRRPRDDWHRRRRCYDDDDEEDDHDVEDYDWEVGEQQFELGRHIDLRTGASLRCLGDESLSLDHEGHPLSDVIVAGSSGDNGIASGTPADFVLEEDNGDSASATRIYRRMVLVLSLSRDTWLELAAQSSVSIALARLLSAMRTATEDATSSMLPASPSGAAFEDVCHSLLTEDLRVRGPVSIAAKLFDAFFEKYSDHGLQLPPAFLEFICASPHSASSDRLLSRIFRDYTPQLVEQDPNAVAAALSAVAGHQRSVDALCEALRSLHARIGSPLFGGSIQLARVILETPRPLLAPAGAPVAGQKRRRDDGDVGISTASERIDQAVARAAWLDEAGRGILRSIASSSVATDGVATASFGELVRLVLLHGRADAVELFVRSKLRALVSHRASLDLLFEPRDASIATAIERAIADGVPQLAVGSGGRAILLALVWHLCRLSIHQTTPSPSDAAGVTTPESDAFQGDSLASQCVAAAGALSSEPFEPSVLSLVPVSSLASLATLGLRIFATPLVVADDLVARLTRQGSCWRSSSLVNRVTLRRH